jgi:hypothetical protein
MEKGARMRSRGGPAVARAGEANGGQCRGGQRRPEQERAVARVGGGRWWVDSFGGEMGKKLKMENLQKKPYLKICLFL